MNDQPPISIRATLRRRLAALAIAAACALVLVIAAALSPDPAGHGTHTQLGMSECNWVTRYDMPCPTCGMTTSFTHAVRGHFAAALRVQPFGFALSILTAAGLILGLYVTATGTVLGLDRLWTRQFVWFLVAALAASWAYKILTFQEMT